MRIAISGASGYIGSEVIKKLNSKKISLTLIQNKKKIIATNAKIVKKPISKSKNYFKKINHPEIFIHLAWNNLQNHNSKSHIKTSREHFLFLKNLIEQGLKNLIVVGTCFEYGDQNKILKENAQNLKPFSNYGKAKNSLRKNLFKLQERKKFKLTWIRLFYNYGKMNTKHIEKKNLWDLISANEAQGGKNFKINSAGHEIRDYLHINSIAANIAKLTKKNNSFGIVNVCSNKKRTIKNTILHWRKKYKLKSNFIFNQKKSKKESS